MRKGQDRMLAGPCQFPPIAEAYTPHRHLAHTIGDNPSRTITGQHQITGAQTLDRDFALWGRNHGSSNEAPRCTVSRTPQLVRLRGVVQRGNGAVGPFEPALRGHIQRTEVPRVHLEQTRRLSGFAAFAQHHVPYVRAGLAHQRHVREAAALQRRPPGHDRAHPFGTSPRLACPAAPQINPGEPIAGRGDLLRPCPELPFVLQHLGLAGVQPAQPRTPHRRRHGGQQLGA